MDNLPQSSEYPKDLNRVFQKDGPLGTSWRIFLKSKTTKVCSALAFFLVCFPISMQYIEVTFPVLLVIHVCTAALGVLAASSNFDGKPRTRNVVIVIGLLTFIYLVYKPLVKRWKEEYAATPISTPEKKSAPLSKIPQQKTNWDVVRAKLSQYREECKPWMRDFRQGVIASDLINRYQIWQATVCVYLAKTFDRSYSDDFKNQPLGQGTFPQPGLGYSIKAKNQMDYLTRVIEGTKGYMAFPIKPEKSVVASLRPPKAIREALNALDSKLKKLEFDVRSGRKYSDFDGFSKDINQIPAEVKDFLSKTFDSACASQFEEPTIPDLTNQYYEEQRERHKGVEDGWISDDLREKRRFLRDIIDGKKCVGGN